MPKSGSKQVINRLRKDIKVKKKMVQTKRKPAAKNAKKVTIAKGIKVARGEESRLQKKPGGSSVGEYKTISKKEFCGPSGGAPKGSYPVNTKKRCTAALAYAHNAPNPSGIRACVKRKCKSFIKKFKQK